jgi:hypothetical protein
MFSPNLPPPLHTSPLVSESTMNTLRSRPQNALGGGEGSLGTDDGPGEFPCSIFSTEIPRPQKSLVSVLFTNVLPLKTGAPKVRLGTVKMMA